MAVRFVLDTNGILYALAGHLAEPLPKGRYFVSVISTLELLSFPAIEPAEEQQIHEFLTTATVVELTNAIKNAAIQLRRRYRLKLADAIIAGTAAVLGAELITNDRRLSNVAEITVLTVRRTEE